jgi:hypothetical protein
MVISRNGYVFKGFSLLNQSTKPDDSLHGWSILWTLDSGLESITPISK